MAYDAAYAIPLNAREAMRGSPSPRKVFAMMANDARARARRLSVSVKDRADGAEVLMGEFRTTIPLAVVASLLVGKRVWM